MNITAMQPLRTPAWRRWVAGGLLLMFLALQGLSLSTVLHEHVCSDASAPDHQCAVTLLTQGQLEAPTPGSVSLPVRAGVVVTLTPPARVWVPTDHPVEPARGPPSPAV